MYIEIIYAQLLIFIYSPWPLSPTHFISLETYMYIRLSATLADLGAGYEGCIPP